MFPISPGPQALGQKERLGAPPASTAHLVMAATEASHIAKEGGDPPTPYPSVPRTPTLTHTQWGEASSGSPPRTHHPAAETPPDLHLPHHLLLAPAQWLPLLGLVEK